MASIPEGRPFGHPFLSAKHYQDLRKSGLSGEAIRLARLESVTDKAGIERIEHAGQQITGIR